MKRDTIAQLKTLKHDTQAGWADDVAQTQAKNKLLKAIGHHEDRVVADAQSAYLWWRFTQATARPIGVVVLLVAFTCGGWFTTVKASSNSLPGDMFYGLKLASEQAKLFLTPEERRAVLHTEFAQRRLHEVRALQERIIHEPGNQYVTETMHALETEVVKAGHALAVMELSGNQEVVTVASVLDEKIGLIESGLGNVSGTVADAAKQTINKVNDETVNTIVDRHEQEETQQSGIALDRSFKNEYTALRERQTFNLGRLETIQGLIEKEGLEGVTSVQALNQAQYHIKDATDRVAEAMNLAAAGGYRAAFEILRTAEEELLDIEAQLADMEMRVIEATQPANEPSEQEQDSTEPIS